MALCEDPWRVLPLSCELEEATVPCCVGLFTFSHDRVVARLGPKSLLQLERARLSAFRGHYEGVVTVGVVQSAQTSVPTRHIRPDVRSTLEVFECVKQMELLRARICGGRRGLWEDCEQLILKLCNTRPEVAPRALEELGRSFIAVGELYFARRCVSRAREIEAQFMVPIDVPQHQHAMREFAEVGVCSVKVLSNEAKIVRTIMPNPMVAFDWLMELNLRNMYAGNPPYAAMMRDLRVAGARAGLQEAQVDGLVRDQLPRRFVVDAASSRFLHDVSEVMA